MDSFEDFSEEDQRSIAAWQRERRIAGRRFVVVLAIWFASHIGCGVAAFYLGGRYGAATGWAAFLILTVIIFFFFNWVTDRIMFKTGKVRRRR